MSKRVKHLLLVGAVPVLILLGMCILPLYTLYNGEEITLQTKPLDPTDVFRGDYIALRYDAEEVPVHLLEKDVINKVKNGQSGLKVYVTLMKKNGVDVPLKVSFKKPIKGLYLKGTINYIGPVSNMNEKQLNTTPKEAAYIEYSLDKYFVEDNSGAKWEKASAAGNLLAKAKVFNGYAILTGLKEK